MLHPRGRCAAGINAPDSSSLRFAPTTGSALVMRERLAAGGQPQWQSKAYFLVRGNFAFVFFRGHVVER